LTGPRV